MVTSAVLSPACSSLGAVRMCGTCVVQGGSEMVRMTQPAHRVAAPRSVDRHRTQHLGSADPSTGGGRAVRKTLALIVTATAALAVGAVAVAGSGGGGIKGTLTGYEENMAISTPGVGRFDAHIDHADETIRY